MLGYGCSYWNVSTCIVIVACDGSNVCAEMIDDVSLSGVGLWVRCIYQVFNGTIVQALLQLFEYKTLKRGVEICFATLTLH